MKVKNIAYACALAVISFANQADDNTSMHVTLQVMKSCSLSASDMDFSRHSSADTSEITASSELSITCTKGTPWKLTADSADQANGTFYLHPSSDMTDAANIAYKLYSDASKSKQITSTDGLESTGTGTLQNQALYGVIEANALTSAVAGQYDDDVNLYLTY
jgi:spore coat protein U-like protein